MHIVSWLLSVCAVLFNTSAGAQGADVTFDWGNSNPRVVLTQAYTSVGMAPTDARDLAGRFAESLGITDDDQAEASFDWENSNPFAVVRQAFIFAEFLSNDASDFAMDFIIDNRIEVNGNRLWEREQTVGPAD